jgi:hypothetical protein
VAVSVDNSLAGVSTKTLHTENPSDLSAPGVVKGTITKQEAQPTEAGNQRTIEVVNVPADQVAVSVDNSPSGVSVKTLHTENPSDLSAPAIVKGTITRQDAQPTEAGNQRTIEVSSVPTDQVETSFDQSAFATSQVELHTENSAPLVAPTPEAGKRKSSHNRPTEAGNTQTQEASETAIKKTTSFQAAYTDDSTIETEKVHNDDTMPVITDVVGVETSIDGDTNDFDKVDYTKRTATARTPKSFGAEGAEVTWDELGNFYGIFYRERWINTLKYFSTAPEAAAYIHNASNTSVIAKSGGKWLAHKIVRYDLFHNVFSGPWPASYDGPVETV